MTGPEVFGREVFGPEVFGPEVFGPGVFGRAASDGSVFISPMVPSIPRLVTGQGAYKAGPANAGPALYALVVRNTGIEPVTSSVSGKRSPTELIARV